MAKLSIAEIIIPPRVRADLGNITELADDIKLHGLLHPVVINSQNELIAGYRRLQAAISLGWTEIPVTIIPTPQSLAQFDMQLAENIKRKDLNPLEISEAILERKHQFEQIYGPIQWGGDHCSDEYQKSKFTAGEFALPDFYMETAKLLNKSTKYIYDLLQLTNLDPDLKEQVRDRNISYRTALEQQAERNRTKRELKNKRSSFKSVQLPDKQNIAPLQAQFRSAPNLFKLFMLIQHSEHTIRQLQEQPLEYDSFELEYLFLFLQQLDTVIAYYQELRNQLNQTQEQKLTAFADSNKNG